jgi:hypothetical protein
VRLLCIKVWHCIVCARIDLTGPANLSCTATIGAVSSAADVPTQGGVAAARTAAWRCVAGAVSLPLRSAHLRACDDTSLTRSVHACGSVPPGALRVVDPRAAVRTEPRWWTWLALLQASAAPRARRQPAAPGGDAASARCRVLDLSARPAQGGGGGGGGNCEHRRQHAQVLDAGGRQWHGAGCTAIAASPWSPHAGQRAGGAQPQAAFFGAKC